MLSMLRKAWILKELVCERENVYMSVCVTLRWGQQFLCCVASSLPEQWQLRPLCYWISQISVKSSVWSLGEGQGPEELDKPIETPPLSTLLIEKPQSATVSVGELTIQYTSFTNRCWWPQAANGSTSRCRGLSPEDTTVSNSATWNKRKTFPPCHPHSYLCDIQKWALDCKTDFAHTGQQIFRFFLNTVVKHSAHISVQCRQLKATCFGVSCI